MSNLCRIHVEQNIECMCYTIVIVTTSATITTTISTTYITTATTTTTTTIANATTTATVTIARGTAAHGLRLRLHMLDGPKARTTKEVPKCYCTKVTDVAEPEAPEAKRSRAAADLFGSMIE